jgi:hypothetical protein
MTAPGAGKAGREVARGTAIGGEARRLRAGNGLIGFHRARHRDAGGTLGGRGIEHLAEAARRAGDGAPADEMPGFAHQNFPPSGSRGPLART